MYLRNLKMYFVPFDADDSCGSVMFCGTMGHVRLLFSSISLLLTVGYHLQLHIPVWPCCLHQRKITWIIRESERGRERGEAGGVGGKGRVLRDRMSTGRSVSCQIQCFSTEALTLRIITPGKPRDSPLNQVILLFFLTTKA